MQKTTVIGLVGAKGSGKGTFPTLLSEILPDKKIIVTRFSDILKETLAIWTIPSTRKNLQDLAVFMEEGFGDGTLANATKSRIEKIEADIVIIDGIRWWPDVKLLRSFERNYLVYITASPDTRFKRTSFRKEKIGKTEATYEQFINEEQAKNELNIPEIGKKADFLIDNEGDLEDYKNQVEKFIEKFLKDSF